MLATSSSTVSEASDSYNNSSELRLLPLIPSEIKKPCCAVAGQDSEVAAPITSGQPPGLCLAASIHIKSTVLWYYTSSSLVRQRPDLGVSVGL
jgi:hypothetical protein